jgi:hypothetical protein
MRYDHSQLQEIGLHRTALSKFPVLTDFLPLQRGAPTTLLSRPACQYLAVIMLLLPSARGNDMTRFQS